MAAMGATRLEGRCEVIEKQEISELARELSLDLHVVEKDYVLGWLLAGIAANSELSDNWVFKGGTCLNPVLGSIQLHFGISLPTRT